jgi:hypothetical protein
VKPKNRVKIFQISLFYIRSRKESTLSAVIRKFDDVFLSVFLPPASLEAQRTQSLKDFSFAIERTAKENSSIFIELELH